MRVIDSSFGYHAVSGAICGVIGLNTVFIVNNRRNIPITVISVFVKVQYIFEYFACILLYRFNLTKVELFQNAKTEQLKLGHSFRLNAKMFWRTQFFEFHLL